MFMLNTGHVTASQQPVDRAVYLLILRHFPRKVLAAGQLRRRQRGNMLLGRHALFRGDLSVTP